VHPRKTTVRKMNTHVHMTRLLLDMLPVAAVSIKECEKLKLESINSVTMLAKSVE
jgi:hypothetical protein